MNINIRTNYNAWRFVEFLDGKDFPCIIEECSGESDTMLKFGVKENTMYLSRDQVKALLPLLECFVKSGDITPIVSVTKELRPVSGIRPEYDIDSELRKVRTH